MGIVGGGGEAEGIVKREGKGGYSTVVDIEGI